MQRPPRPVEVPSFVGHIVKFKDTVQQNNVSAMAQVLTNRHKVPLKEFFSDVVKGFATSVVLPEAAIEALKRDPNIDSVEPDFLISAFAQYIPSSLIRIGGSASGIITNPGPVSDVRIFILDTGVQLNHPDLNVVQNMSFVRGERDGNDLNGHGTMVAGVAAARNNTSHIVGVAPGAPIHAYKVLDKSGNGSLSNIIKALDTVVRFKKSNPSLQNKIVVNMSLGGFAGTTSYNTLDAAIANAVNLHNITVIVAAGNENMDASLVTPAHTHEAITVGSYADTTNVFSAFSNFGPVVDILAPGEKIFTTNIRSTTSIASGTSFSSPAVAGAAALYLSKNPSATPKDVHDALMRIASAYQLTGENTSVIVPTSNTVALSLFVNGL